MADQLEVHGPSGTARGAVGSVAEGRGPRAPVAAGARELAGPDGQRAATQAL